MSRATTAPGNAREYETIYILKPDIDADSAEKVGGRVVEVMEREKGKLTKVELWGRRRLAYDIAKHKRGVYVYLKYLGDGGVVSELERNLRLFDQVLKYQTVLLRSDLPQGSVEFDEEAVKFERLELGQDDDELESKERLLGLVEAAPKERPEEEDNSADDDSDDSSDEPAEEAADSDGEDS